MTLPSSIRSLLVALALDGLYAYEPGPPHAAFLESTHPRILVRAGNQTGKTWAAAAKAWRFAIEHPGSTILVVCANWTTEVEAVGKALWDLAPRHLLKKGCDWNLLRGWKNSTIELTNGSSFVFRFSSPNAPSLGIESITVHAAWIDEPPKQSDWGAIVSRVSVNMGPIWLTMTPVGREVGWIRKMVEGDSITGEAPAETWQQIVFKLTPHDCPWRSPASITQQCEGYGAWDYAQRVHGDWEGVTADRVLDGFTEASVSDQIPWLVWNAGIGIDHGELAGREAAVLALWSYEKKLIWIVDEYISSSSTTPEDDAREIAAMLQRRGQTPAGLDMAIGDVNSAGKLAQGQSVNQLLEHELPGLEITTPVKGPGSVDYRLRLVNLALRRGHLKVHPRCKGFVRYLRHYRGGKKDEELGHVGDGAGYLLVRVIENMYDKATIDRIRMIRP